MHKGPMAKTNNINQKRLSSTLGVRRTIDDMIVSKVYSMDRHHVLTGTVIQVYTDGDDDKFFIKVERDMSTDPPYICQMANDDPDITIGSLPQVDDEVIFLLPNANKGYLPTIIGISSQAAGKLKPEQTMNYRKEGEIRSQVGEISISLDSGKVVVGDVDNGTEDAVLRRSDLTTILNWIAFSLTVTPAPSGGFVLVPKPGISVPDVGSIKLKVTG